MYGYMAIPTRKITVLTHLPVDKMAATCQMTFFKRMFLNESVRISIRFSLKFVSKGPIDNKSALVWVMACRLFGAKT